MTLNVKIEVFVDFLAGTHILRPNCAEITRDRPTPGQPAYKAFSVKRYLH